MRRLKIIHHTEYRFSQMVTLQPHRFLLYPREGHNIRIVDSKLDISPANSIKWHLDIYGNSVAVCNFLRAADTVSILSTVTIEHYEDAPLDFVVEEYALNFPFTYLPQDQPDLALFQQLSYPADRNELHNWWLSLPMDSQSNGNTQTYVILNYLSNIIAEKFVYTVREEPGVQSPSQTLAKGSGSCRDYTTLFVEVCRDLGIASRFVSGYLHTPSTELGHASTHMWAEVYLPGAGWKGFDPTSGGLASDHHIPVAVARHPEWIPPVAGSFIGVVHTPAMLVNVQVTAV